jgi:hypothetical protein
MKTLTLTAGGNNIKQGDMTKSSIVDQVFRDAKIDPNKQKDLQLIIELCHMCMDRYADQELKAKDEQIKGLLTFLKWQEENWHRIMNQSEYGIIAIEGIQKRLNPPSSPEIK